MHLQKSPFSSFSIRAVRFLSTLPHSKHLHSSHTFSIMASTFCSRFIFYVSLSRDSLVEVNQAIK